MTAATLPLQLLLLTVSGWVHRHQQDVIAYLVEENRVLKEQLGGRKLRLTDDQRRRLAAKARLLGRRALDAVATLVTPDTRRWCADAGRPTRFTPSSPSPTDAVRDGSAKLGHPVQNVTREHGLTPLPR